MEVRRAIELSFGVVSGVSPGIHVLDGRPRASGGRGCFWRRFWHFWHLRMHCFNRRHDAEKCIRLVCEKLTIFPYTQNVSLNSVYDWLSYDIVRFKIQVGVDVKCI